MEDAPASISCFASSTLASSTGTSMSIRTLAKISPKAKETAAGMRYCTCSEVSLSSGANPITVVIVVVPLLQVLVSPSLVENA